MAQTGYTPLSLYYSSTTTNVPLAANLVNGELAINTADGKLFYKDNGGTVQVIGWKNVPLNTLTGIPALSIPVADSLNTFTSVTPAAGQSVRINAGGTAWEAYTPGSGSGSVTSVAAGTGMSFATITSSGSVAIDTTVVPQFASAGTFTATQTFNGTSSTKATQLLNAAETVNVVASAPSSTTNFYVNSGAVQYYTTDAANNWTLNVAFSSGTSLNTAMAVGDSITIALLAKQGSTAYYQSALTIDGSSVTPLYQGGTAWTSGNASGVDAYVLTIIKTASATYTVIASQTQYK